MGWLTMALLILFGYVVGSIPFSYLVARTQGVDLRKIGSGNTGASNVWRSLGFRFFVVALALDILKGALPTWIAYRTLGGTPTLAIAVGLAAILGHVYPIFMRFRGGKAVATFGGVVFAFSPVLLVASALIWSIIYKLSGYPSVASLLGFIVLGVLATAMAYMGSLAPEFVAFIWIMAVVVFYLHRANIDRLMRGTENRIGPKTK
jgi:acyl phosphate:glycerol-3-phosphate acyltransferase